MTESTGEYDATRSVRGILDDALASPKHGPRIRGLLDSLDAVVGASRPLVGDQVGGSSREIGSCPNYTARSWSPTSTEPEDDRCINCGHPQARHIGGTDQ